ncbi:MAG: ABC transporter permease, partial [Acidobacteriaceae bacterium]
MSADLKYALRQLRKSPGFTLTAVLTLALGIGANAAIFSIVSAVLQHPAGVDNPAQVAVLHTDYTKFTLDTPVVSVPDFAAAASLKDVVEAAALEQGGGFNIVRDGHAVHISAARVSWQWFQVFGARPILGHTFVPEEDTAGAAPVAMLSYGLWQRAFGGRADVVGQTILLNEKPYRVVGVMGSDFAWPRASEVWVPLALPPSAFDPHNIFNESYQAGVRLRPGVTVQRLTAEWSAQLWSELRRLGRDKFPESAGWSVYATPLTQFAAGPLRRPLYVLSGVVALVLLIAAANVAGLFLARASGRSREIAIRMALGASASRLLRQVFAETALLTAIACAAGVAAGPL